MNVEKLIQALENEDNADILKYSLDDLENIKINILEELEMNEPEIVSILTKLKQYKYVEHPNELKYGSYVRWISLENPDNLFLAKGAVFCKWTENCMQCPIVLRNYGNNQYFQLSWDSNLIFQKFSNQEYILLQAMEHLS
jgi:hypothetical protein